MAVLVHEALQLIKNNVKSVETELIKIEEASGRICAKDIFATYPLPRFDNSAMDGYAVNFEDANCEVKVISKSFAGDEISTFSLQKGECVKVMTGASIPQNTTAIVPQEDIEILDDHTIKLPKIISKMQFVRFVGEDIDIGEQVIKKYQEIHFGVVAMLASQGITDIEVYKKPKIAIFASGEEIRPHYEKIEAHQIFNSNSPSLMARCKELGCEAYFMGSAKDSIESLSDHIRRSLDFDLIITSGGVSVGEADFTKEAFDNFDMETIFDGIIVKPGKPTIFGKIDNTYVLNLPGNPFSSQIIFEMFGTVMVQQLRGSHCVSHKTLNGKMGETIKNKSGRITLIPGKFDGEIFHISKKKKPGMVSALAYSNALLALDENVKELKEGSNVSVIKISHKGFTSEEKDFLTYE
jgi:molybdopterin molybdotransferase